MGVILWHQVEVAGDRVSSDVLGGELILDADIRVTYGIGLPGRFTVSLHDLPLAAATKLAGLVEDVPAGPDGGVPISLALGYLDGGPQAQVLAGRVERVSATAAERPVTTLSGGEEAAYRLLNQLTVDTPGPPATIANGTQKIAPAVLVGRVAQAAGVGVRAPVTPTDVQLSKLSLKGRHALDLVEQLSDLLEAEWLALDGELHFGTALAASEASGLPSPPDPSALAELALGEDCLVTYSPFETARLASFTPLVIGRRAPGRERVGVPAQETVSAFDFTVMGLPTLRAGQLVTVTVQDYGSPFTAFRIIDVTHEYSRQSGYACTGRAVRFEPAGPPGANRRYTAAARGASPEGFIDRMTQRSLALQRTQPAVEAAGVESSVPARRVATLRTGQQPEPAHVAPSVDAGIDPSGPELFDKPLLAPFAWHQVGLSVPVYPGMRALVAHSHSACQDAVLAGFLWANEPAMKPPPAAATDWWLCLPTKLGSDDLPDGGGANDLVAGDGRRVIECASLNLRVGSTLLTPLGKRPNEAAADVLLVEHTSKTKVTIAADGAVTVEAVKPITLTDGKVKLEIGGGKVKVS